MANTFTRLSFWRRMWKWTVGKSRRYAVLWRAGEEFKCGRGCYVVYAVFTFYGGYEPENAYEKFMKLIQRISESSREAHREYR